MNKELHEEEGGGFKNPSDTDHHKDGEGDSIATCRICYGDEDVGLISPCMCTGTQQYVHRSCLDHWRSSKGELDFSHCSICKAQFHFRVVELEENELENIWRKIKFSQYVARDVCLVFLAVQSVIGMMGVVAYLVDKDGSFRNLFNDNSELTGHPIPLYYRIGVDIFFGLVGIIGTVTFISWRFFGVSLTSTISVFVVLLTLTRIRFMFPAQLEPNGKCFTLRSCVQDIVGIGHIISFLIFVVIIWKIWGRHCHVLPKRELTKEYVVEDLNGCYTPAKLDPQHVERLKRIANEVDWRLLVNDHFSQMLELRNEGW